jgi:hypothetical protein
VVEDDPIDARPALGEAIRRAFVGAVHLEVVFPLPLAFQAIPERLTVPLVAVTMAFEQAAPLLRQRHGVFARAADPNRFDQPVLAEVPQVA